MQQHVFSIAKVCSHYGVEHAVICPGSRSAPLVYAFTRNPNIKCHSVIDERSAAFMALGMAQQLQKPVVLICTSGSASLNFFPAIAEAYYQKVPLLILTADRPPEMLNQQDGQMIMQKGVFGKHVLGSHELMCFEENNIDFNLTERIVHVALEECMQGTGFGPVHINVPLREPLYNPSSQLATPKLHLDKDKYFLPVPMPFVKLDELATAWRSSKKKMILVGQFPFSKKLESLLHAFINREDVVVLSDIVSNQHEASNAPLFDTITQFSAFENLEDLEPELILSFGGPFLSRSLRNWLKKQKPTYHFRLQSHPEMVDTYSNVTHPIQAKEIEFLEAFVAINQFRVANTRPYSDEWKLKNKQAKEMVQNFCNEPIWAEPIVIQHILKAIPENSQIQIANSSVIRFVSWLGIPLRAFQIYGNRGTSGIDGSNSTAIGSAKIQGHKTITLITGDLSLLYDRNAFWQNNLPSNLRIIVFNNFGGGIFEWIDGPSLHPEELNYFTTPQANNLTLLAQTYDLNHLTCSNIKELPATLTALYEPQNKTTLLELKFEGPQNLEVIKAFRKMKLD